MNEHYLFWLGLVNGANHYVTFNDYLLDKRSNKHYEPITSLKCFQGSYYIFHYNKLMMMNRYGNYVTISANDEINYNELLYENGQLQIKKPIVVRDDSSSVLEMEINNRISSNETFQSNLATIVTNIGESEIVRLIITHTQQFSKKKYSWKEFKKILTMKPSDRKKLHIIVLILILIKLQ
jgi:hypothetical protein